MYIVKNEQVGDTEDAIRNNHAAILVRIFEAGDLPMSVRSVYNRFCVSSYSIPYRTQTIHVSSNYMAIRREVV